MTEPEVPEMDRIGNELGKILQLPHIFSFWLPIVPMPYKRPRSTGKFSRSGKPIMMNDPKYTKYRQDLVTLLRKEQIPDFDWLSIWACACSPYPKATKPEEMILCRASTKGRGDADNYVKPVKDSLEDLGTVTNDKNFYIQASGKFRYLFGSGLKIYLYGDDYSNARKHRV